MQPNLQETRTQGTLMRPLKIYLMQDPNGKIDVPYHWQENTEILWIQRGELSLKIQEKNYIGKAGDIIYINPRELHGMQSQTLNCTYLAFIFPLSWLQFAQMDEAAEMYLNPLTEGNAQVITQLPSPIARQMGIIFQEIYDDYCNSNGNWLMIKANLLRFYACLFQNNLIIYRQQEYSAQIRLLLEIARYMQTHYKEKLSLKELGQVFHMSPKYFSTFFQKHFSRNLTEYLTSIRIECAKKMLVESDAAIELISQQAGFSSSSYFIRMFHKSLGLTPGQYRKKFKNNSNRSSE
ncbi:MAG: AraC family transcriptional regulator [Lachnospiraceae bacterium]|nr:AraC family transcriptional regulator [Lachnospiraceae bacterium]